MNIKNKIMQNTVAFTLLILLATSALAATYKLYRCVHRSGYTDTTNCRSDDDGNPCLIGTCSVFYYNFICGDCQFTGNPFSACVSTTFMVQTTTISGPGCFPVDPAYGKVYCDCGTGYPGMVATFALAQCECNN